MSTLRLCQALVVGVFLLIAAGCTSASPEVYKQPDPNDQLRSIQNDPGISDDQKQKMAAQIESRQKAQEYGRSISSAESAKRGQAPR